MGAAHQMSAMSASSLLPPLPLRAVELTAGSLPGGGGGTSAYAVDESAIFTEVEEPAEEVLEGWMREVAALKRRAAPCTSRLPIPLPLPPAPPFCELSLRSAMFAR